MPVLKLSLFVCGWGCGAIRAHVWDAKWGLVGLRRGLMRKGDLNRNRTVCLDLCRLGLANGRKSDHWMEMFEQVSAVLVFQVCRAVSAAAAHHTGQIHLSSSCFLLYGDALSNVLCNAISCSAASDQISMSRPGGLQSSHKTAVWYEEGWPQLPVAAYSF